MVTEQPTFCIKNNRQSSIDYAGTFFEVIQKVDELCRFFYGFTPNELRKIEAMEDGRDHWANDLEVAAYYGIYIEVKQSDGSYAPCSSVYAERTPLHSPFPASITIH